MRVSKPPHERKAELVAAARRLFDEKGVEHTRVSDIVRQVGVAQGVFYYYFRSKEEMVEEVVRLVDRELQGRIEVILSAGETDFCQKLADYIELFLDLVDQFLGDDEERLHPQGMGGVKNFTPAAKTGKRLMEGLQVLVEEGAARGAVTVPYPWESARVVLYGLLSVARDKLPTKEQVYTIAEQGLGLAKGSLVKHLKDGTAAKPEKESPKEIKKQGE